MKARRTPQQKKQDAYERDTRVVAEYPKAYRKNHARKKAMAHQRERRRMDAMVAKAIAVGQSEDVSIAAVKTARAEKVQSYLQRLGDYVADRLERRRDRVGTKKRRRHERTEAESRFRQLQEAAARFAKLQMGVYSYGPSGDGAMLPKVWVCGEVESVQALAELARVAKRVSQMDVLFDLSGVKVTGKGKRGKS